MVRRTKERSHSGHSTRRVADFSGKKRTRRSHVLDSTAVVVLAEASVEVARPVHVPGLADAPCGGELETALVLELVDSTPPHSGKPHGFVEGLIGVGHVAAGDAREEGPGSREDATVRDPEALGNGVTEASEERGIAS